jgi:chemotaxis protein CheD
VSGIYPRVDRSETAELPPGLPQFAHIQRSWNSQQQAVVAKLLPGDYYVTRGDELIFTVLGSCVSACVRERKLGIGGMNHFMLPLDQSRGSGAWNTGDPSAATRYGNVAMECLINDILKLGGQRANLEFKVIGGGKVLDMDLDVGARNADFVREYLRTEGFAVTAADLGDRFARKLFYNPATGMVRVKRLGSTVNKAVFDRERQTPLPVPAAAGSVELF